MLRPLIVSLARFPQALRRWGVLLGVFIVLGLAATSSAPEWHAALHHDCDHADHQCAITDWAQYGAVPGEIPAFFLARAEFLVGLILGRGGRLGRSGAPGWAWAQGPPCG